MKQLYPYSKRLPAATVLMVLALVAFVLPLPRHVCLNSADVSCLSCCCHQPSVAMSCCAGDTTAPLSQGTSDAEIPGCCYTVYSDDGSVFLATRAASGPLPVVVAIAPSQHPVDIAHLSNASPAHPALILPDHGTRRHLVLCQFLI